MSEELYEVEEVCSKRWNTDEQRYEYKVAWKGYSEEDQTWEPIESLSSCHEMVKEFELTLISLKREKKRKKKLKKRELKQKKESEKSKRDQETLANVFAPAIDDHSSKAEVSVDADDASTPVRDVRDDVRDEVCDEVCDEATLVEQPLDEPAPSGDSDIDSGDEPPPDGDDVPDAGDDEPAPAADDGDDEAPPADDGDEPPPVDDGDGEAPPVEGDDEPPPVVDDSDRERDRDRHRHRHHHRHRDRDGEESSRSRKKKKKKKKRHWKKKSSSSPGLSAQVVYCVCREPYDESKWMLQCGLCDEWYHGDCIGLLEPEAAEFWAYHCASCLGKSNPCKGRGLLSAPESSAKSPEPKAESEAEADPSLSDSETNGDDLEDDIDQSYQPSKSTSSSSSSSSSSKPKSSSSSSSKSIAIEQTQQSKIPHNDQRVLSKKRKLENNSSSASSRKLSSRGSKSSSAPSAKRQRGGALTDDRWRTILANQKKLEEKRARERQNQRASASGSTPISESRPNPAASKRAGPPSEPIRSRIKKRKILPQRSALLSTPRARLRIPKKKFYEPPILSSDAYFSREEPSRASSSMASTSSPSYPSSFHPFGNRSPPQPGPHPEPGPGMTYRKKKRSQTSRSFTSRSSTCKFADLVAEIVIEKFHDLCEQVEVDHEGETVLAGFVLHNTSAGPSRREVRVTVISIGVGTKYLREERTVSFGAGDQLHDSHAEILARRRLLRYFLNEIEKAMAGDDESLFEEIPVNQRESASDDHRRYRMKPNFSIHLYTSSTPCGDAADFDRIANLTDTCHDEPNQENIAPDILPGIEADPLPERDNLGIEKKAWKYANDMTRGFRQKIPIGFSHYLTCSDKVARWNVVGLQGALLSYFIQPIYLRTLTVGRLHHSGALDRAMSRFLHLVHSTEMYTPRKPELYHSAKEFGRDVNSSTTFTAFSMSWDNSGFHENSDKVEMGNGDSGRQMTGSPGLWELEDRGPLSWVCKRLLFKDFLRIRVRYCRLFKLPSPPAVQSYYEAKQSVGHFSRIKQSLHNHYAFEEMWSKSEAKSSDEKFTLKNSDI